MFTRRILLLALYASLSVPARVAQGSVCSSGIFPALQQKLGSEPLVISYCAANYLPSPVTVVKCNAKQKHPPKPSTSAAAAQYTARQQPTTTIPVENVPKQLKDYLALGPQIVRTVCSCIQRHPTVPVYDYISCSNFVFNNNGPFCVDNTIFCTNIAVFCTGIELFCSYIDGFCTNIAVFPINIVNFGIDIVVLYINIVNSRINIVNLGIDIAVFYINIVNSRINIVNLGIDIFCIITINFRVNIANSGIHIVNFGLKNYRPIHNYRNDNII